MAVNRGKAWENKVKEYWLKTFPGSFILRLPDQVSGYRRSSNISDFVAYKNPRLFLIECKSIHGNTESLNNLSQYYKLKGYEEIEGVRVGFIIWWCDHNVVAWVPIQTIEAMINAKKKSVNVKDVTSGEFNITKIPCEVSKVFPKCDFSILMEIE